MVRRRESTAEPISISQPLQFHASPERPPAANRGRTPSEGVNQRNSLAMYFMEFPLQWQEESTHVEIQTFSLLYNFSKGYIFLFEPKMRTPLNFIAH